MENFESHGNQNDKSLSLSGRIRQQFTTCLIFESQGPWETANANVYKNVQNKRERRNV